MLPSFAEGGGGILTREQRAAIVQGPVSPQAATPVVPIQKFAGPNPRNRTEPIRGNQVIPIEEIAWVQSDEIAQ